jgi:phosphoglycolate phosphatase-like HAD superfamily hydrolase
MVQRALAAFAVTPGLDVWFAGDSTTDTIAAKAAGGRRSTTTGQSGRPPIWCAFSPAPIAPTSSPATLLR